MANEMGFPGLAQPGDGAGQYGALLFMMRAVLLKEVRTIDLVKIVAVTNSGGVSPVGFVDVQPLVNQVDGNGNATPHGVLHHLPYFRLQGGADAVILDPKAGDIGFAVFACRDISSVKATRAQANPGSNRSFDMADGVYIGGILNGTPAQYLQFTAEGINVVSPSKVTITAPQVEADAAESFTVNSPVIFLNGNLAQGNGSTKYPATLQGPLTVVNDVTAQGTSVHTHTHGGVQTGSGSTGAPNP